MASDPVTKYAANCQGCGILNAEITTPSAVLDRLPTFWNRESPEVEGELGSRFNDETVFDFQDIQGRHHIVLGIQLPEGLTPQYELARTFVTMKNEFRLGWRQAEALQLGLGEMRVNSANRVMGECPHAAGSDLDRVGEQYGIGRPSAFNDCCYWRFVVLCVFKPGPTAWLVKEICELFTGVRPSVTEAPAHMSVAWPLPQVVSEVDPQQAFFDNGFFDDDSFFDGALPESSPLEDSDGWWLDSDHEEVDSFWTSAGGEDIFSEDSAGGPTGISLQDAIAIVKPAGVAVTLVNEPLPGIGGCLGVVVRDSDAARETASRRWG